MRSFRRWPNQVRKGTDKEQWKAVLRWCGVSWEPKIQQVASLLTTEFQSQYQRDSDVHKHRYHEADWELEHFPECVANVGNLSRLTAYMNPIVEATNKKNAIYHKTRNGPAYHPKNYKSFSSYQLRHAAWLPYRRCLLHDGARAAPHDVYFPGSGLEGLLPEVDKVGVRDEEWWGHVAPFLRKLELKEELPKEPKLWHEWMRRLPDAGRNLEVVEWRAPLKGGTGGGIMWRAAWTVYQRYLKLDGDDARLPDDIGIPCAKWVDGFEQVVFASAKKVLWVDESHLDLADVRRTLLDKAYKLFIVRLTAGTNAPERLGLRPLSDRIKAEPQHTPPEERESQLLADRYWRRRLALNKAAGPGKPLPEVLTIHGVRDLRVSLETEKDEIAKVTVLALRWSQKIGEVVPENRTGS